VTFPAVAARYIRLYMTEMNSGSYRVRSLEVYAGAGTLAQVQAETVEAEEKLAVEDEVDAEEMAIDDAPAAPHRFELQQNYPNPFNPHTEIRFELEDDGQVVLRIYNTLGQVVRTLEDGQRTAGEHKLAWDARDDRGQVLPSGMYAYTLEARSAGAGQSTAKVSKQTRTMTLLK